MQSFALRGAAAMLAAMLLLGACASNRSAGTDELRTSSDQTDNQKRARIRLQLAVGYYEHHEYQVALDEIKRALEADPDFSDAYNVRALIYMEMKEPRLADENFHRALQLTPANPELNNNYGWFLCQSGRAKESIGYFEAALKSNKYQAPEKALNNAGICSLKLRDTAAAESYFLKAFQADPGNPVTNGNLATLYYDKGDYQRARFYIGRVIKDGVVAADVLWLAVRVEHKLGDRLEEARYASQLHLHFPDSPEYARYARGAFDE